MKTILNVGYKLLISIESKFDKFFLAPDVPLSNQVTHQKWQKYLSEIGNKPGMRVLEVGSREVGGIVLVETHFSYKSHEAPWHFFQFTNMALRTLFSKSLGFECLEAGVSNPIVGRFSSLADEYLKNQPVPGLYCHTEFLGRKVKDVPDFDWNKVDLAEVVEGTKYPAPKE